MERLKNKGVTNEWGMLNLRCQRASRGKGTGNVSKGRGGPQVGFKQLWKIWRPVCDVYPWTRSVVPFLATFATLHGFPETRLPYSVPDARTLPYSTKVTVGDPRQSRMERR